MTGLSSRWCSSETESLRVHAYDFYRLSRETVDLAQNPNDDLESALVRLRDITQRTETPTGRLWCHD
jgi:hypothetical protein